jgi:hypothetical protein
VLWLTLQVEGAENDSEDDEDDGYDEQGEEEDQDVVMRSASSGDDEDEEFTDEEEYCSVSTPCSHHVTRYTLSSLGYMFRKKF